MANQITIGGLSIDDATQTKKINISDNHSTGILALAAAVAKEQTTNGTVNLTEFLGNADVAQIFTSDDFRALAAIASYITDGSFKCSTDLQFTGYYEDDKTAFIAAYPNIEVDFEPMITYMKFADNAVLQVLLNNGIGDGTGITQAQAEAVTSLPSFNGNSDIISFDELEVFENIGNSLSANVNKGGQFRSCTSLKSIKLPECITKLNDGGTYWGCGVFSDCSSLTNISFKNINYLGTCCFKGCSKLEEIATFNDVTHLGESAFNGCSALKSITLNGTFTTIPSSLFHYCTSLKDVAINSNVVTISSYAFYNCTSLTNIILPDTVESIEKYAFSNCNLTGLTKLPDSLKIIGTSVFSGSALNISELPSNLQTISDNVFDSSGVSITKIPDTVTSIGMSAFAGCSNLTTLEIGSGVKSIGSHCFNVTYNLKDLIINAALSSVPSQFAINSSVKRIRLNDTSAVIPISQTSYYNSNPTWYVPDELYDSYIVADNWSTWYSNGKLKKISEWTD